MISALLVVPNMREHAHLYRDMRGVVFDAFIPVVLGPQYVVARNADFWIIAPGATEAMSPEYFRYIQGRLDARPGAEVITLADYMDRFFNLED